MKEIWIILLALGFTPNPVGKGQVGTNVGNENRTAYVVFKSSADVAEYLNLVKPSSGTYSVVRGSEQDVKADIRFTDKDK